MLDSVMSTLEKTIDIGEVVTTEGEKYNGYLMIHDISGMGTAIHKRVHDKRDPRYGRSHPMRIK